MMIYHRGKFCYNTSGYGIIFFATERMIKSSIFFSCYFYKSVLHADQ
jgi:hypothetical protein